MVKEIKERRMAFYKDEQKKGEDEIKLQPQKGKIKYT